MGCKYLTETKEALDCSKNQVLLPLLASFYFQRYSKVHWVARTDFIIKHETFLGMSQNSGDRIVRNYSGEKRTMEHREQSWSLNLEVTQTRAAEDLHDPQCSVCACVSIQDMSQCPCCLQPPRQWSPRQTEAATALSSCKQLTRQQGCKNQITTTIGSS